jgi:hypothetical protein
MSKNHKFLLPYFDESCDDYLNRMETVWQLMEDMNDDHLPELVDYIARLNNLGFDVVVNNNEVSMFIKDDYFD